MLKEMFELSLKNGSKVTGTLSGYDRGTDSYLVRKSDDSLVMVSLEEINKRERVLVEIHVNRTVR